MKKLYLSKTNKKFAGVIGGLGEYLNIDPTALRLLVVLLALITAIFPMLIAYILAWIIMPEEK